MINYGHKPSVSDVEYETVSVSLILEFPWCHLQFACSVSNTQTLQLTIICQSFPHWYYIRFGLAFQNFFFSYLFI